MTTPTRLPGKTVDTPPNYNAPSNPWGSTFGGTNPPPPPGAWNGQGNPPSGSPPITGKPIPAPPHAPRPTAGPPAGPTDPLSGLPVDQRNAYASLQTMLQQYGLQSLASQVLNFVKQGYTGDALNYLLSQTPEYKARFSGNDARLKNGLAPLAPADYLNTEAAYKQVLQASGLPAGFYDTQSDFTGLIGNDISPTELQARAQDAFQFSQGAIDPNIRQAFQSYYGVTDGHLAAYFLDPKKAGDLIQRQVAAAQIGGAAGTNGLKIDQAHAEAYANQGVTYAQAQQGSAQGGAIKQDVLGAANRFNTSYSEQDLADATIGNLASANRKLKQLGNSEAGLFAGTPGAIGQFSTNAGGSY